jgi:hypothetical protein
MMPFTIEFAPKGSKKVSQATFPDAATALREVESLIMSDEDIRSVRDEDGRSIETWGLRLLVQRGFI